MSRLLAPNIRWLLLPLLALCSMVAAHADIYKCSGTDGQPVYQDSPCAAGRELRNFQTDPATVSVVPFDVTPVTPPPAPVKETTRRARATHDGVDAKPGRKARAASRLPAGNASERKFLYAGMSDAEILARIGPPDVRSGNAEGRGGARWSYLPADGDAGMITTLHLQGGKVTQVDRKPVR
ncbi:MAG: DUF4124 domain-containing protein [Casimicrobiaceae bacterium]